MTEEEWGPWIEHHGKGRPVPHGTYLHVITKSGFEEIGRLRYEGDGATYFEWEAVLRAFNSSDLCIIRYRIRKPRALQQLREIAENVKENA